MGDETRQAFRQYHREHLGLTRPLVDTPRARNTDRDTSHHAAAAIKATGQLGEQQREALAMVRRFPGKTTAELAKICADETGRHWELLRHVFGRRLSELAGVHIDGREPRRCIVTGRQATTWWGRS